MIQLEIRKIPIVTRLEINCAFFREKKGIFLTKNDRLCVCMTTVLFLFYYALKYVFYMLYGPLSSNKPYPVAPYLVIVPGISYIFVWTFFIASFIEKNVFMVLYSKSCISSFFMALIYD